jgi:aspartyl-tRNA(Asn)/glutamyl-tRNA(Gln) amidotransferase subunit C
MAQLARLRVDDGDVDDLASRFDAILGLFDALGAADTDGVEPMAHPLDAVQKLRADEVTETDQRDALQAVAPLVEDGLYLVPRVVE